MFLLALFNLVILLLNAYSIYNLVSSILCKSDLRHSKC